MSSFEDYRGPGPEADAQRAKLRALEQKAEALENQAATLVRQAAEFGVRESPLNAEIEKQKAALAQLTAQLDALHAERALLLAKAETLREEAAAAREQAFECEAEIALSILKDSHLVPDPEPVAQPDRAAWNDLAREESSEVDPEQAPPKMSLNHDAQSRSRLY